MATTPRSSTSRCGKSLIKKTSARLSAWASRRAATKSSSPSWPRSNAAACLGSSTSIRRLSAGPMSPATRDKTTILPPCCTRSVAVARPSREVVDRRDGPRPADPHYDQLGARVDVKSPMLFQACNPAITNSAVHSADDLEQPGGTGHQTKMELGSQQPAYLERLGKRRRGHARFCLVGLLAKQFSLSTHRFAIAQCGKEDAPGSAITHERVESESAYRDDQVGVGQEPVEVNAPSLFRCGKIG